MTLTTSAELLLPHDGRYDAALECLHSYGPDCSNGFVNHAAMAIEALAMLGLGDEIAPFVRRYESRLLPAQPMGAPLSLQEQGMGLGNAALYPRWQSTFRIALTEASPREVLAHWVPILSPGCMAAAFHGVLMTTHALRGLESEVNSVRLAELTRGLAYWAATYQPLPGEPRQADQGEALALLLAAVPLGAGPLPGAIDAGVARRTREDAAFAALVSRPRALEADAVAPLAAAGARALLAHPDLPIVFVHAITGPVAFRTLRRWVDAALVERAIDYLWQAVAGLFVTFTRTRTAPTAAPGPVPDRRGLIEAALDSRDEHAIKVVDAALVEESISGGGLIACAAEFACHRIRDMR